MQPTRQIYYDAPSSISIPEELRHQTLEVIIWPLEKSEAMKIGVIYINDTNICIVYLNQAKSAVAEKLRTKR